MTTLTFTLELDGQLALEVAAVLLKSTARAPGGAVVAAPATQHSAWTDVQLTEWLRNLRPVQRAIALKVAEAAQSGSVATTQQVVAAATTADPTFTQSRLAAAYSWLEKFARRVRGTSWPGRITSTGVEMDSTVAKALLRISKTI